MQMRFILVLIVLQCLAIQSKKIVNLDGIPIHLEFRYISGKSSNTTLMPVTTRLILAEYVKNFYVLISDAINHTTFLVREIKCWYPEHVFRQCTTNFESPYIFLQNPSFIDNYYALRIENQCKLFKEFLHYISRTRFNASGFNLTYIFVDTFSDGTDKPNDLSDFSFSKTTLFGIIFLSICVSLVLILCLGWFIVVYYRRFRQYRMKKKLRKALAQSTELMLSKSPVIIFDPHHHDSEQTDNDPTCAICLDSFKAKEKIRKLVCSHYFHVICIDPWLLSHQSCPLCNRNILRRSIPSISSSIMATINERNNEESTLN